MNPFNGEWSNQQSGSIDVVPNLANSSINQSTSSMSDRFVDPRSNSLPTNQVNVEADKLNNEKPISSLSHTIYNEIFSNYKMLICKLFYFFFYSAFGSLFPLIGIYFKQQGMSATETGILIGSRCIVQIFSAPFWATLAEKFNRGKTILIGSLISCIILTNVLAFIRPPTIACISYNGTDFILYEPYLENTIHLTNENIRNKRWILDERINYFKSGLHHYSIHKQKLEKKIEKQQQKQQILLFDIQKYDQQMRLPPNHVIGKSPLTIEYALNYDKKLHFDYVSPPFSHIVYRQSEVDEVFILLLFLMIIGEFFASPIITIVDTMTIRQLGNNLNNYSKQRMFGSFGWAISMVIVGLALDNSTEFVGHSCGAHLRERNYNVCFKIFAFLMIFACVIATQFDFDFKDDFNKMELKMNNQVNATNQTNHKNSFCQTEKKSVTSNMKKSKFEFLDQWKSGVFAQRFDKHPEWYSLVKSIMNIKLITLVILAWFFGSGVGLVFTFLFWHLQDIGGTPTLFGIASVLNHVSEILAYFFSLHYIKKFGHTKVLSLALLCNFFRFLYISYIDNSWLILPFEFVQGITHATVWACFCSYFNHTMPEHSKNYTQPILQIVYIGFGKGLGSIIGGFLISSYGTRYTFAIYAFFSLIAICIFVLIMNVYKKQLAPTIDLGTQTASGRNRQNWLDDDLRNRNVNQNINKNKYNPETLPVNPHGVPSLPIPHRLTKTVQTSTTTRTRLGSNINFDDKDLDEYIKNHRDWRITMNKNYD